MSKEKFKNESQDARRHDQHQAVHPHEKRKHEKEKNQEKEQPNFSKKN